MTNFEKRISELTPQTLVEIEEDVLECDRCYCVEYCQKNPYVTCLNTRVEYLMLEAED